MHRSLQHETEGWTMSHRYESNVREYLQRATPQEWSTMEDREQRIVDLAAQIRESVASTEDQLLGQTSSTPDYLQEVGRRGQITRQAEEIALQQVLHEAFPAEEMDENEPELVTGPLWSEPEELPPNLQDVPTLAALDLRISELAEGEPTARTGLELRRLQEQRPVVEFLRSLDWPQWRTVRPSLETIARDRFQQPLWDMVAENFFAVMSVELQQGNPQRLLRERLLQP